MTEIKEATVTEEAAWEGVMEIEPEAFELKPAKPPVVEKLPPPPPSARLKGRISELRVLNDPKLARDLMTKNVFTIGPDDILEHLEEHMRAFRFRHLPVVEGHKLIGLITHSDLLHASSTFLSTSARERNELIHRQPAKLIMQRALVTVRPTDPLLDVAFLMWESRVSCVPVIEADGTLVGIITEGDFLRLAHNFLSAKDRNATSSSPPEPKE